MRQRKARFFYGYWVLLVVFLCPVATAGIIGYAFSLFVKPLTAEFGWTRSGIMVSSTIRSLVHAFLSPFIGRAVYRFGARKTITVGAIVFAAGLALLSLTQTLWQFYLLFFIVGVGSAAMGLVPGSVVVARWFERRRGLAMGILGAGIGVGGVAAPPLVGSVLIPTFSWRGTFIIAGLIPLIIITPLALFVLKEKPADMGLLPDGAESSVSAATAKKKGTFTAPEIDFPIARRTAAFWLITIAFTAFNISWLAIHSSQALHLQDIGFPVAAAVLALSTTATGSGVGKLCFGWLCDYIKPKYAFAVGILFHVLGVIILMNVKADSSVAIIWVEALLLGLGTGSWLPAMTMAVSTTFGLASYGVIFGFINMIYTLGGSVGPVAAAYVFDIQKSYSLVFITALILYAIALPAILLVRPPGTGRH